MIRESKVKIAKRLIIFCLVAFTLIIAGNTTARADLTDPKVYSDNSSNFKSTIDVTVFSAASFSFNSVNWKVDVRNDFIGSEILANGFLIEAQHLVAPHTGDVAPNPNTFRFF